QSAWHFRRERAGCGPSGVGRVSAPTNSASHCVVVAPAHHCGCHQRVVKRGIILPVTVKIDAVPGTNLRTRTCGPSILIDSRPSGGAQNVSNDAGVAAKAGSLDCPCILVSPHVWLI